MAKKLPFGIPKLPGKPVDPVRAAGWLAKLRKRQTERREENREAELKARQGAEDIRDKPLDG